MPSPLGHSMVNVSLYMLIGRSRYFFNSWKYLPLCLLIGLFSDIDILFIALGASAYFHRGLTHSILFAVLIAFTFSLAPLFKSKIEWRKILLFFLALTSGHLLLDYFTFDGFLPAGILLFWPFNDTYFQSPYCIFRSFDWMTLKGIFSFATFKAILLEFIICLPFLVLAVYIKNLKRRKIGHVH